MKIPTMAARPPKTDTLTLDQLAVLSDSEMVRRRFDASNRRVVGLLSMLALFVACGQLIAALVNHGSWGARFVLVAVIHFLVAMTAAAFFGELASTEKGYRPRLPVHLLARNLTPWVLTFLLTEFTLVSLLRDAHSDSWMAWGMMFPWILIVIRLSFSRRAALNISILVVLFLNILVIGTESKRVPARFAGPCVISVFTFLIGAYTSRKLARETIVEWSERRTQAREQLRMRDELLFARDIQLSMLPEAPPVLEWLEISGTSLPATEVGGDYYDYFPGDHSVSIVCGDVAGHGLGSGIVLASLRSGFTLLRDSLDDPAAVLQRLNDLVARISRRRMVATAAVVRFDDATRRATLASAGHPPVLVRNKDGVKAIELFAPPLGVRLPYQVPSCEVPFDLGDLFVLHSDGIYESRNEAGESYGLDRLQGVLAALDDVSAERARDTILRDVELFRGAGVPEDDVTIVVVRITR